MLMQRLSADWRPMREILIECFSQPGGKEALEIMDKVYERMKHERERLLSPEQAVEPVQLQGATRTKTSVSE
jgi:hypothetical protein